MRVLESILIGLTLLRTVRALSQSVNKDSGNAFLPSCRDYLDLAAVGGPVRSAAASAGHQRAMQAQGAQRVGVIHALEELAHALETGGKFGVRGRSAVVMRHRDEKAGEFRSP